MKHVPPGARVLDLGAGHGIFSILARDRAARPVAVDPDARKVRKLDGIESVIGYDDCIRGTFDAVVVVDVLYKMPIAEWDALLERLRHRLKPDGVLIVKEHDPTSRIKHFWNRMQERLASAMNLTLGESFSYETPAEFTARLRRHGFVPMLSERIDRGYVHPHMLYVAKSTWRCATFEDITFSVQTFGASLSCVPHVFYWNFEDGVTSTTTTATVVHRYGAPGTYNVTVRVSRADTLQVDGTELTLTRALPIATPVPVSTPTLALLAISLCLLGLLTIRR